MSTDDCLPGRNICQLRVPRPSDSWSAPVRSVRALTAATGFVLVSVDFIRASRLQLVSKTLCATHHRGFLTCAYQSERGATPLRAGQGRTRLRQDSKNVSVLAATSESDIECRTNHLLMRLLEVMARRLGDEHGGVMVTVQEGLPPVRLSRQQVGT